jgi:hypothetical protein
MSEVLVGQRPMTGIARRDAAPPPDAAPRPGSELFLYSSVGVLAGLAWLLSRYGGYTPGSDLGYYLGLAGGVALLIVLLYPLRKHSRFLRSSGAMKGWFALHMAFGIGGSFLILAHSTFYIGSINAGVALVSMLLVAGSGIVGRYIYTRIHHGLYGTRATLAQLQSQVGFSAGEVRTKLYFAPKVERRLREFEARALRHRNSVLRGAWSFFTLSTRAGWAFRRCCGDLTRACREHARAQGWDAARHRRHLAVGKEVVYDYLYSVHRVAQFSRYERLFSLWHILHVPLVWMLVLSAIVHVIAVHAY